MWHFEFLPRPEQEGELKERVYDIFISGFNRGLISRDVFNGWYVSCLQTAHVVGLLEGDAGVCFLSMPQASHEGGALLWVDGICMRPGLHAKGAGQAAIKEAATFFGERKLAWIGGRTQSPYFARLLQKFGPIWPLDTTYTEPKGQELAAFMAAHVGQLSGLTNFNPSNGVCTAAYKIPLYPPDCKEVYFVPNYDPEQGDAVVCVSQVRPQQTS